MDDGAVNVSGLDRETLAKIGPAMQGVIDQGLLSGVVTLVWRNGQIAQVTANGQRNREIGTPMERDTIFRIASMTKPVTSVAALMLMEEGKLALDDAITKWLPEFADMQVLKDPQGPVEDTYPSPRDITVEDLFTHRAGQARAGRCDHQVAARVRRHAGPEGPARPGRGHLSLPARHHRRGSVHPPSWASSRWTMRSPSGCPSSPTCRS